MHCPGLTCIQEGWQYHSLVDFQLGVKLDSILLPDICTESSETHTGFCNSGSALIINVHYSGEGASQVNLIGAVGKYVAWHRNFLMRC